MVLGLLAQRYREKGFPTQQNKEMQTSRYSAD